MEKVELFSLKGKIVEIVGIDDLGDIHTLQDLLDWCEAVHHTLSHSAQYAMAKLFLSIAFFSQENVFFSFLSWNREQFPHTERAILRIEKLLYAGKKEEAFEYAYLFAYHLLEHHTPYRKMLVEWIKSVL